MTEILLNQFLKTTGANMVELIRVLLSFVTFIGSVYIFCQVKTLGK